MNGTLFDTGPSEEELSLQTKYDKLADKCYQSALLEDKLKRKIMKKTFKIVSMERQEADEKNRYPQYVMEIISESGKNYKAYAGIGKWNKQWQPGGVGEAEIEIRKSKTGNDYVKLGCPEELKPKKDYGGGGSPIEMQLIITKLNQIIAHLGIGQAEQPEPIDDRSDQGPSLEPGYQTDIPRDDGSDINVEDIPF